MRKLLMVVDSTPECMNALRFAAQRAAHTNAGIVMLYVIEPDDFQHWVAVQNVMSAERRTEAETYLAGLASKVHEYSGVTPELVIREGKPTEQVLAQIEEDQDIRILVLGASTQDAGPGPLIADLITKRVSKLRTPIVVVPGNLTDEEIDAAS